MKRVRSRVGVCLHLMYLLFVLGYSIHVLSVPSPTHKEPNVLSATSYTSENTDLLSPQEFEIFKLVNKKRLEAGLPELKVNPYLVDIAQSRAKDMAVLGYYSHKNPEGRYYYNLLNNTYDNVYSCENLELESNEDAQLFVDRWMASEKHRNCLLSPKTSDIGYALKGMKLNTSSNSSDAYVLVAINSASPN